MIRKQLQAPPRFWSPKLSPFWVRVWRPFRLAFQRREQRLQQVEVQGLQHLRDAIANGNGVMVTPNHPGSADPYIMYRVADELGSPFYFMAAWQLFGSYPWLVQQIIRQHGVFSVDREGTDMRAFKESVKILTQRDYPLVIFPEGEVYHTNDRVTPFREGPATIALSAAKRAKSPVCLVPAAIKYHYLEDPTENLIEIMDDLESAIYWRPRRDMPLPDRIYRFAEGPLALKELEYSGHTSAGPLTERVAALCEFVIQDIEQKHEIAGRGGTVPERIKVARHAVLSKVSELAENDPARASLDHDLDDIFFTVQLFTYPGDYVAESPSVERMAETLDKFAEDVLGQSRASVCADRMATVLLGEPIEVAPDLNRRKAVPQITDSLEERVQGLLDQIQSPPDRQFG